MHLGIYQSTMTATALFLSSNVAFNYKNTNVLYIIFQHKCLENLRNNYNYISLVVNNTDLHAIPY